MEFKDIVIFAVLVWSALAYSFAMFTSYDLFSKAPPTNTQDTLLCVLVTATAPGSIIVIMVYCAYNRRKGERYEP